jgi:ethanolamine kinase
VEANAFALASHQYWGVWALIQARYSPIDFDYLGWAAARGVWGAPRGDQ